MESLDRVAVRFEEVFRHLVNGDGPTHRAGQARGPEAALEEVTRVG
jgi:hypothetical protein